MLEDDFRISRATGGFSALQRAEIAEIADDARQCKQCVEVSVLFNEPKLLKFIPSAT